MWASKRSDAERGTALVASGRRGLQSRLQRGITGAAALSISVAVVAGCGTTSTPAPNPNSVSNSYNFSGTTSSDGNAQTRTVTCTSGSYVQNSGSNSGTILDAPYLDRSGTDQGVGIGRKASSSVQWGHIGSRLATGIEVWAQNDVHHRHSSLHFSITVRCTGSQGDAWVIAG